LRRSGRLIVTIRILSIVAISTVDICALPSFKAQPTPLTLADDEATCRPDTATT
jgi:hypothetical protein